MNTGARTRYSLGQRLSWLFAAQTLVGFGLVSVIIYAVAAWTLSAKADVELSRKRELIMHLVAEAAGNLDLPGIRHKLDDFLVGHNDLKVILLDRSGAVVYESAGELASDAIRRTDKFALPPGVPSTGPAEARIAMDRSADERLLASLAVLLCIVTLLGALIVSVTGFWLVHRSLLPLRGLAEQTKALRPGRLGERLTMDTEIDEVQPWVDQFNGLLGRLDYAYRQLEAFSADVAHELRTPLANLLGETELALLRPRSPDELRETLASNLEEVRRMTTIVNDMLFLAQADHGARVASALPASLAEEVAQVLEFYEGTLEERALTARVEGDVRIAFDAGLVKRAVSNLLGNAARYADPGSEIRVELRLRDGAGWILVHNRGTTISPAALPQLFQRFYRAQTAREGSREHHGLGLAIVAAIARMHGGTTCAQSANAVTTIGFSIAMTTQPAPELSQTALADGTSRLVQEAH